MLNRVLAVFLVTLTSTSVFADTIAVIGTGDVGRALGIEFAKQGHTIVYGSRDPERRKVAKLVEETGNGASATTPAKSVVDSDIVVLAVPGMMVEEITLSLGDLSDKIIIDPTNPLERKLNRLEHSVDTSNAEIIQAAAPDAHVVKAFNTLNWKTMIDPDMAGGPVSIPLAGDNGKAKKKVAELVSGMGLDPIDVGPVRDARWVEGMLILWINNRYGSMRDSFDYHLRRDP